MPGESSDRDGSQAGGEAVPLRLALIGLRGSGKSRVGAALAAQADVPLIDLDRSLAELHVAETRSCVPPPSVGAVFAELGEPRFRKLELRALALAAARPGPQVLATGGGVVERSESRRILVTSYRCVWLRAPLALLLARLEADPTPRPRLAGATLAEELALLEVRRGGIYAELAELVIDVEQRTPEELARTILTAVLRDA